MLSVLGYSSPKHEPHSNVISNNNPRQLQLLEEVRNQQSATVEQLAETLGVTLQTVRRDVQKLAGAGLLLWFSARPARPALPDAPAAKPAEEGANA